MNEELVKRIQAVFAAQIVAMQALCTDLEKTLTAAPAEEPKKGCKKKEEAPPVNLDLVEIEHPCGCVVSKAGRNIRCETHKQEKTVPVVSSHESAPIAGAELGGHPHDDNAADLAAKAAAQAGGAVLVGDVTIEMLRERSVIYSAIPPKGYGMEAWLALVARVLKLKAGEKASIKGIPKEMYGAVWAEMGNDLAKLAPSNTAPAAESKAEPAPVPKVAAAPAPAEVSIEVLKKAGGEFIARNGQPAFFAVLKVFGAMKLSEVDPAKRGALLEAISNA